MGSLVLGARVLRDLLMHFDDIALGILEKDLMPLLGKGRAIVGIGDALTVKVFQKSRQVVRPKRDVAPVDGVDHLPVAKRDIKLTLGQMHLHRPLRRKADLAIITCRALGLGARKVVLRNVVQLKQPRVKIVHPVDVVRDEIDMVKFKFHGRSVFAFCVARHSNRQSAGRPLSTT